MKCLNDEIIFKYLNGILSAEEERNAVEDHLGTCAPCKKALEAEKKFDLALKKGLREDYRFARLSELILERAKVNQERAGYHLKWFAITGGLISALAIFNSFALTGLVLYLNDFSIAKIVINISAVASSILRYFSIYGIWLSIVSATLYTAVAIFAFTLFFARKTILKTVKI